MDIRWVYITTKDRTEARKLGRHLLEQRLVACVNIIESIESMYWWDGRIQDDREAALVAKTEARHMDALVRAVKEKHSYECPCVVALPIREGNLDFMNWINEQTQDSPPYDSPK